MTTATTTRLPAQVWRARAEDHASRADALTTDHRERRARGAKHAIEDFLYEYYSLRPSHLRRWHPGPQVVLEPGPVGQVPHATWRWYRADDDGVRLDVDAFLADRGDTVRYVHGLLEATASRRPYSGCFGLHEWAMVYRQREHRHPLPLRLGQEGTDAVVEAHRIRCSHFDAFRFFTPDAAPRNALQPTRATQPMLEQPGCLHANMDVVEGIRGTSKDGEAPPLTRETQVLYEQPGCLHANMDLTKWCMKLGPAVPGDLLLDSFELAHEIRYLDMQASPYDLSSLGERAVAIETPNGAHRR